MKFEKFVRSQSVLHQAVRTGLRSTVARNAASLYLIQFANYIVPLIMVPYLVRVLGPAGYGTIAFARGFINYLMLFVEYGFNWSATREISVHREDHETVNHVALHVWAAKGLLSLLCLGMLFSLIAVVPKLKEVYLLLLALYGIVLGNVLFPTWLFQGMERMVAISVINLGMKVAVLVGVFTLVHRTEDAVLYAALIGGGFLGAGLVGAMMAVRMFNLKLVSVTWSGIWETLKEGWVLFLSKASVSLYTAGNAFILGMLTNHTVVGYYSAAEKIVRALVSLLEPVAQSVYPAMAKKASEAKEKALYWARIGTYYQSAVGTTMSIFLFATAPFITKIVLGPEYADSIPVMRLLSPLPLLIALSSSLGRFIMLPFRMDNERLAVFTIAGIANVILGLILAGYWGATGMAASVLISEMLVTLGFWIFIWRRRLNPWRRGTA